MKKKCTACNYEGTMPIKVNEGNFFYECSCCGELHYIPYMNVVDHGNDEYAHILELMYSTEDYMFTYEHISEISKAGFETYVYLDDYRVMKFDKVEQPDYFYVDDVSSVFLYGKWINAHVILNNGDCSIGYSLREE